MGWYPDTENLSEKDKLEDGSLLTRTQDGMKRDKEILGMAVSFTHCK